MSVINLKAKMLNSLKEKSLGLMGKKPEVVYFETRWGIHTYGVLESLDILILDNTNVVKIVKENLHPNKVFFWNIKYNKVIEMPGGYIKNHGIKKEDKIIITK